jgi:creatinine amidohydrolase
VTLYPRKKFSIIFTFSQCKLIFGYFVIKWFREGENLKVMLHEMSWTEAKEYFRKSDIAILPVGSNEQHGPHNPLGTDHLIAKALAEETAKRTGVLCLEVIPFGVSPHHKQFWGTVSVSPETLKNYVKEVCLSLNFYGVTKILIVNGHGGNLNALMGLARELREKGIFVSVFQWWPITGKLLPELFKPEERRHACAEETSVNLALNANIVNMRKAVDEEPRKPVVQTGGVTLPLDTIDYTNSGVFGKSKKASAEKGKKVFKCVVNEIVKHVNLLKKAKIEDLMQKLKV